MMNVTDLPANFENTAKVNAYSLYNLVLISSVFGHLNFKKQSVGS